MRLLTPIETPADFVKPDGSYDFTPLNCLTPAELQNVRRAFEATNPPNPGRRKGDGHD